LSDIVVVLYSRLLVVETALSLLRNVVEHSNIVKRVDDAQTYQWWCGGCLFSITLSTWSTHDKVLAIFIRVTSSWRQSAACN